MDIPLPMYIHSRACMDLHTFVFECVVIPIGDCAHLYNLRRVSARGGNGP